MRSPRFLGRDVADIDALARVHSDVRHGERQGLRNGDDADTVIVNGELLLPHAVHLFRLMNFDFFNQLIEHPRGLLARVYLRTADPAVIPAVFAVKRRFSGAAAHCFWVASAAFAAHPRKACFSPIAVKAEFSHPVFHKSRNVATAWHTLGFVTSRSRAASVERTMPIFLWRTRMASR